MAGWVTGPCSGFCQATKSEQLTHVREQQQALSDRRWNGCEIELDRIELLDMAEGRVRGLQVGRRTRGAACSCHRDNNSGGVGGFSCHVVFIHNTPTRTTQIQVVFTVTAPLELHVFVNTTENTQTTFN